MPCGWNELGDWLSGTPALPGLGDDAGWCTGDEPGWYMCVSWWTCGEGVPGGRGVGAFGVLNTSSCLMLLKSGVIQAC